MKKIKIILGIITAAVIVFFLTGLIVKETNYTTQVSVNKPIAEVFKVFNNSENLKSWIPEIKSLDVVKENLGKTGSVYNIVVESQGQKIAMTQKTIAYVQNEKVTLFFDAENMLKTNDYLFSEENGVTTIMLNATCKSESFIMACVFPYFKGTFKEQDLSYLKKFKTFAENK